MTMVELDRKTELEAKAERCTLTYQEHQELRELRRMFFDWMAYESMCRQAEGQVNG